MSDKMLTLQQVASRLQVSEKTIHRKLESGAISGNFISNRWRFTEADVQAYIKSCERKDGKGAKVKRKYTKRAPQNSPTK